MIKEMRKVQIIGPKGRLDECITALHAASVVHIETVPLEEGGAVLKKLPIERDKLERKEALERASERLRNLLYLMKEPESYRQPRIGADEIFRLIDELTPVESEVKGLRAVKDGLTEELSAIERYERLLRGFAPIVSRLGGLKNFEITGLTMEKTREDTSRLLEGEVARITGGSYEMHTRDLDEATVGIVITYPRRFGPDVRFLLSGRSIDEIRLPDEYSSMPLIEALKAMARRKAELPLRISGIAQEMERISERWYGAASGLLRAVGDALDEIGVLAYAAETRFAFVIEGWVPLDTLGTLKDRFAALFGEKVLVRVLETDERELERAPVCIENPRFLRPFEVFLSALPPPKYGSVDPTPYVALFFPAFFGLIVGDIGYGAVILLSSLYLRRRFRSSPVFSDIFTVLSVGSFSAVVFGFLFGEFFGDLGTRLGLIHPILFHRTGALKTLMVLTVGIGAAHVVLGVFIGLLNHLLKKRMRQAGAKLSYLIVIISFLSVVGIILEYVPRGFLLPGVLIFALSFAALTVLEGIMGPLEFIKAIGNILSYVRIMAVGTASVVMALVANRIGSLSENLVLGIIAAGLIHLLNVLLSVLSPSVQSMRLHYVEFFSKFYEGGGRRYEPFKKRQG